MATPRIEPERRREERRGEYVTMVVEVMSHLHCWVKLGNLAALEGLIGNINRIC